MRKFTLCLMILALCALPAAAPAEGAPLRVTASFYPLYVAALNIAGGVPDVTVTCLAPVAAGCLHDYQMTTADRRTLADTDILILNGAGLEAFLDDLLPSLSAAVIVASEGLELIEEHEGEVNPHVWVSPEGMMAEVRNIADGLGAIDPDNAKLYEENALLYISEIAEVYAQMQIGLAAYAGEPIVTFHESFAYFADAFGLNVISTVQGDHQTAPSGRSLAILADLIREENVKALFAEPQYEDASVDILSKETGVPVYLLDPVVSGPTDPEEARGAYLAAMEKNLAVLREALQ